MTENGIQIPDFLSENSKEIDLSEFLSKIENQLVLFEIKTLGNPGETKMNQWTNSYVLSVKTKDNSNNFKVKQIIHFEPKEKRFGSKTRTVWEMKLMDVVMD
ncbi:MAG: hypothetical protein WBF83_10855 [Moheibacter sp.]